MFFNASGAVGCPRDGWQNLCSLFVPEAPMVTPKRVIILAVIVIAGLCLLDADHVTGGGLCAAVLAVTIGLILAVRPALAGRFHPVFVSAYRLCPEDLPTLPPKA